MKGPVAALFAIAASWSSSSPAQLPPDGAAPPAPGPAPAPAPAPGPPSPGPWTLPPPSTAPPAQAPPAAVPPAPAPPGQAPASPAAPPAGAPGGQPSYLPPGASAPPAAGDAAAAKDEEVDWFLRVGVGLGPDGVGSNNAILSEVGYPNVKMWAEIDGAYMFHRHVGVGVWMGLNRRAADPAEGAGVGLNAVSYFIGVEVPILLWGPRAYAFHLTPRGGFLSGQVELDNPDDAPFQKTGIVGAGLGFNSFTYHLGANVSYTYAPTSSPGGIERTHDHGGFYVTLHGSIDG